MSVFADPLEIDEFDYLFTQEILSAGVSMQGLLVMVLEEIQIPLPDKDKSGPGILPYHERIYEVEDHPFFLKALRERRWDLIKRSIDAHNVDQVSPGMYVIESIRVATKEEKALISEFIILPEKLYTMFESTNFELTQR